MDISYANTLVYGGEHSRLYREVRFINSVCNVRKYVNNPINVVDQDLGCFILVVNG